MMSLFLIFSVLAILSIGLNVWQWLAARRFPLHQAVPVATRLKSVTVLKPLRGYDAHTQDCLRSWLSQPYPAPLQVLFGVKEHSDPVCDLVSSLMDEFPNCNARLVICPETRGVNPKVSTLMQLEPLIEGEAVVISDADVKAPRDYLTNAITILQRNGVGLVTSFHTLANPQNCAMWIEAIAMNCDFWSQVCQSNSMRPMKFALGAAMGLRRDTLQEIGGFRDLADYVADDNRLGSLVHRAGMRVELTNAVVGCYSGPTTLWQVWHRQLRWARTIRACEPLPFFFSVLANATIWLCLTLCAAMFTPMSAHSRWMVILAVLFLLVVRYKLAELNGRKLGCVFPNLLFMIPMFFAKDVLNLGCWALAFLGNRIDWRGRRYRILRGGRLEKVD